MSTVPFIFAGNTGNIPLSQLDVNFANAKSAADFVIANNQANITSVGTLTGLAINGNILGNGVMSITGNTTVGNNLSVVGTITAAGNTIHGNIFTSGLISAAGSVTGGNILTGGLISAAGNILTTGLVSATGNVNSGNVFSAGLISAVGNVTGGNVFSAGLISAVGNVVANTLNAIDTNLTGNLIVNGNATVNGTTTTINVQTLNIADKDIVVANNVSTSTLIDGAGILAGNPTVASIVYSDAIKGWTTANNFSVGSNLIVAGTTTLTGVPTAPTPANATANTQIATTAFVSSTITNLGLGTMSTQDSNSVDITGGSIVGITDLAVQDGGTGLSSLIANAVLVGNGTGAVQAVSPGSAGNLFVSNGTTWTTVSLANSGIKLGLGITGEVWNNMTGSRSSGVVYTNSRSYPIAVSARGTAADGGPSISVTVGGVFVQSFNWQFNGAGARAGAFTIVPAGATYQLTFNGCGVDTWAELF
jgi:hypothetical protein